MKCMLILAGYKKRAGGQYPPARSYIYRSTRKTKFHTQKREF